VNPDSVAVEWDVFTDIARVNAWLDHNPPGPHEDAMRVMKVGEEYGEAVAAYIGMTGQNPRKGITHSQSDLLRELADVAVTALCAIQHFTRNTAITRGYLASKLADIITRADIPALAEPERQDVSDPGAVTFHAVDGATLTAAPDEDGVMIRADFHGTKLPASGARELARHLTACADQADDWMQSAADPGPGETCPYCGHQYPPGRFPSGDEIESHLGECPGPEPEPEPEPDPAERCPDCGRASCTGEECYWPDEAGITRAGDGQ
jgi:hypothetical protein